MGFVVGQRVSARTDAWSRRPTTPATYCAWRWLTVPTWPTWARRGGCRSCRSQATRSDGKPRSRSVRLERTRPRSIIVNRAGKRFVNEANSMAGAFHYLDPRDGDVNDPAWMVFDSIHHKHYGFWASSWISRLVLRVGDGRAGRQDRHRPRRLTRTIEHWNTQVLAGSDPDFGRGSSAYDGLRWGDDRATTRPARRSAPSTPPPTTRSRSAMGTKWLRGPTATDESRTSVARRYRSVRGRQRDGRCDRPRRRAGGTIGPAMFSASAPDMPRPPASRSTS